MQGDWIAAAGNLGPRSQPLYPAADENVIAVTATDVNDKLLPQANQGPHIALAAPGVNILEPAANTGYQLTTGTSVAAFPVGQQQFFQSYILRCLGVRPSNVHSASDSR